MITTKLASLPEVASDAALYVDPDDPQSLREALDAVRDPGRRATMVAAGAVAGVGVPVGPRPPPPSRPRSRRRLPRTMRSVALARQCGRRGVRHRRSASASAAAAAPHAIPPLGRRVRFELWLKSAALRYLPPRAVVLLRSLRKVVD